jgi:hypothetical protein
VFLVMSVQFSLLFSDTVHPDSESGAISLDKVITSFLVALKTNDHFYYSI